MDRQIFLEAVDAIERHTDAMLADLRVIAARQSRDAVPVTRAAPISTDLQTPQGWVEVRRLSEQTYSWPSEHGGTETYDPFAIYLADGLTLALAKNVQMTWVKDRRRKQIWVFHSDDKGGRKRPISPFVATDDYAQTGDMIAIIRGNGAKGRGMFNPGVQLPPPYDELRVEVLGDRIAGHYTKCAAVAHEDDVESMLRHGAAQMRMRGW